MLRATGTQNGRRWVLLGLGPQNIARLRAGKPVRINLRNLDPLGAPQPDLPDIDVIVAYDDGHLTALMEARQPHG